MTAKPGDGMAAASADRGRIRASHADREHVLEVLKAAFVQGRLTKDELDMRAGQAFASQTQWELAALTADIPAEVTGAQPPRPPVQAQAPHPENKVVNSCACASLAIFALTGALFSGNFELFFAVVATIVVILFAVGSWMVYSSHKKRSSKAAMGAAMGEAITSHGRWK